MNNFFGVQLSEQELRRQMGEQQPPQQPRQSQQQIQGHDRSTQFQLQSQQVGSQQSGSTSPNADIMGGDSLDDIIRDNSNELQRNCSVVAQNYSIEFGNPSDNFPSFEFTNTGLQVATNFPGVESAQDQQLLAMSPTNTFSPLSPDMMGNTMAFSNLNFGQLGSDQSGMSLFDPNPSIATQLQGTQNSISDEFVPMPLDDATANNGRGDIMSNFLSTESTHQGAIPQQQKSLQQMPRQTQQQESQRQAQQQPQKKQQSIPPQTMTVDPTVTALATGISPVSSFPSSSTASATLGQAPGSTSGPASEPASIVTTSVTTGPSPAPSKEKMIYSKSGFDMLRAFWYVGTRKNPKINLGAVDMSCSFVVCDVTMNDCPIIYVSDNFQNLTGYNRHEIVGKNCRFLQAPNGKVEAGSKREFVDNGAVLNLKEKIAQGEEVQQSLINYRKGGKPFLNLLTMIPIPWDTDEIKYFIGFQIDLVECPDAISQPQGSGAIQVDYKHSDIGQYIWTPPSNPMWEPEKTLGVDDVSTLLQQYNPKGPPSDWHRQSWDKMLLENADDVIHVLSLKGLFLYLSPSCKKVLEYDTSDLVGNTLSSVCHPSDIIPVTRELKDTVTGTAVNIVFRIRRKESGYTWFESHGSLFIEQGKGRKCIILVGRKRPVFALCRRDLEIHGGIRDSELWTKLSASGMFLYVSSTIRSLLDLQPETLVGTSIQELMRKESRAEFGRAIEKARRGKIVGCRHEVHNRRGQVLQAQTVLYPGDAREGQKPTFLLAQTKLVKTSSRAAKQAIQGQVYRNADDVKTVVTDSSVSDVSPPGEDSSVLTLGNQDAQLASDDNIFDELKTTRCTSWQYELRQMEKINRILAEELAGLLSKKKKRKRRKGSGNMVRDCANCHTRNTPEWRRGPSGNRDLCNSCGLRWAKQTGRVSPRNSSRGGGNGDSQSKFSSSPSQSSPFHHEITQNTPANSDSSNSQGGNGNGNGNGNDNRNGNGNGNKNINGNGNRSTSSSSINHIQKYDSPSSTFSSECLVATRTGDNGGTHMSPIVEE